MCLYVKEGCKPEIAHKDIVCYKLVEDHVKYWKPRIYAFNAEYSYPYNNVLTAESYSHIKCEAYPIQHLEIEDWIDYHVINEGFHAKRKKTYLCANPCIIPKGTEYCLGGDNDIVAVNMIVFRSVLDYYRYRIKKLWQKKYRQQNNII